VLTVIGRDKPGIVEILAGTVAAHEANWTESRMAQLAGQFAGILRASVPERKADGLISALEQLEAQGLKVVIQKSAEEEVRDERLALTLELVGNDRAGIVRDISRALAQRRVNVEDLTTECHAAPMSGGMLFKATAQLRTPRTVSLDELRDTLEQLANDLMVDITLNETS
jgi:glycine cleavage system regulatory protein